jgi:hypothetical protein
VKIKAQQRAPIINIILNKVEIKYLLISNILLITLMSNYYLIKLILKLKGNVIDKNNFLKHSSGKYSI